MKALITGASSGIGRDMARVLANMGVELYLVARRAQRLEELKEELDVPVHTMVLDLSKKQTCILLYERLKNEQIDILINNAGLGDYGNFDETKLSKDITMIDTNITALHILTKLFLKDFKKRDSGYILNVASSAAFLPGPLMATYYATKSYVLRLSMAIHKELKKAGSHVSISVLCPGPVKTEFDQVANVAFLMDGMSSEKAAAIAIQGMFCHHLLIVPGILMKISRIACRMLPDALLMECSYHIQHHKNHGDHTHGQ